MEFTHKGHTYRVRHLTPDCGAVYNLSVEPPLLSAGFSWSLDGSEVHVIDNHGGEARDPDLETAFRKLQGR